MDHLAFKQWDTVFPNAACAVAWIDRLTHHAEFIQIEGESYRKPEAELAQKAKHVQTPSRSEAEIVTARQVTGDSGSVQIYVVLRKRRQLYLFPNVRRPLR